MPGDLTALPKAHLHVHLESTVRWPTLREIGASHGAPVPVLDGGRFAGFRDFADRNALVRRCLRSPADFRRIALEFCEDEAADGTGYAEVTFTAAAHGERLDDLDMPLAAVLDGLAEGRRAYGIDCRVILDHSRRRSTARAERTLDLARRYAARGVIGFGLAGDEAYPLRPFADVCAAAADAGLHLVHHAGEVAGADSVREAMTIGRAERIGHGIRVLDDADLVAEVRQRRLPLEVCPSSNVVLGLAGSLVEHPFPRLLDAGLVVTVNTDIPNFLPRPGVGARTLSAEYAGLRDAFGLSDAVLADLARASVDASFASPGTKSQLLRGIDAWRGATGQRGVPATFGSSGGV